MIKLKSERKPKFRLVSCYFSDEYKINSDIINFVFISSGMGK